MYVRTTLYGLGALGQECSLDDCRAAGQGTLCYQCYSKYGFGGRACCRPDGYCEACGSRAGLCGGPCREDRDCPGSYRGENRCVNGRCMSCPNCHWIYKENPQDPLTWRDVTAEMATEKRHWYNGLPESQMQLVCGDPCSVIPCPPGYVCRDGRCVKVDPCAGVQCPPGHVCQNGQCVPVDPCAAVRCPPGFQCQGGRCVPVNPCAIVKCPPGFNCVCVGGCPPGRHCIQPAAAAPEYAPFIPPTCVCVPADPCYGVTCPPGYKCQNGQCVQVDKCVGKPPCPPGRRCNPQTGECECVQPVMRVPPVCQILDPNQYECIDPYTGKKLDAPSDCACALQCGAVRQKYQVFYHQYVIRGLAGLFEDLKSFFSGKTGTYVLIVGGAVLMGLLLVAATAPRR